MTRITKEFKIKHTNVRLFDNGRASITSPAGEMVYVNNYIRLEDYVKLDAMVSAHIVKGTETNAGLT